MEKIVQRAKTYFTTVNGERPSTEMIKKVQRKGNFLPMYVTNISLQQCNKGRTARYRDLWLKQNISLGLDKVPAGNTCNATRSFDGFLGFTFDVEIGPNAK